MEKVEDILKDYSIKKGKKNQNEQLLKKENVTLVKIITKRQVNSLV